jgi:alkylation response protein AidB-like acyl-CoA dehydrogenase
VSTIQLAAFRHDEAAARLRDEVRAFLLDERRSGSYTPRSDAWMTAFDAQFSSRLAARGWVGMTIPKRYGGQERSHLDRLVVTEELLAAGAPVAAHWIADRQMAPTILRHGSETQRQRYLPAIARGECFFAIGMSEPDSGSDLASVRTRASETADGWEITGTKVWTTGAHLAHAIVLLARTDGVPADRHSGLSQFVVDLPHPDVHVRPIMSIDGEHHFNEVVFDRTKVGALALLGERGSGWNQVTAELKYERSGPERFMSAVPLLEAWVSQLRADGADDPVALRELGRLTARALTLRQLSTGVAAALAIGQPTDVAAALVKDLGSRFERDVVETVRRTAEIEPRKGGSGLPGMIADAFTLRGGTNEILRSVVARGLEMR